jgi:rRNA maturation endonuclease Nob1
MYYCWTCGTVVSLNDDGTCSQCGSDDVELEDEDDGQPDESQEQNDFAHDDDPVIEDDEEE